ncbi:MAG: hypothetical protein IBX68_10555 [Dehalococcoidia bacterium]|nr:hypothetical protein [Dehalococcoidia bacterium]
MTWELVLIAVLAAPIILLPVVYVWYLTLGGLIGIVREKRRAPAKVPATR